MVFFRLWKRSESVADVLLSTHMAGDRALLLTPKGVCIAVHAPPPTATFSLTLSYCFLSSTHLCLSIYPHFPPCLLLYSPPPVMVFFSLSCPRLCLIPALSLWIKWAQNIVISWIFNWSLSIFHQTHTASLKLELCFILLMLFSFYSAKSPVKDIFMFTVDRAHYIIHWLRLSWRQEWWAVIWCGA